MKFSLKKLLFGTLSGSFGMWAIAGIWHNLIKANFYNSINAKHDAIGVFLVAYFILALMMAYIYPLMYKNGSPLKEGMRFGAIIGILWVLPHGIIDAASHGDTTFLYQFKNALWHIIEQGIGGVIIAFVYGRKLKTEH